MSAESLELAVRELGLHCSVEGHGRLAVLIAESEARERVVAVRATLQALAVEHGFTNVALELTV